MWPFLTTSRAVPRRDVDTLWHGGRRHPAAGFLARARDRGGGLRQPSGLPANPNRRERPQTALYGPRGGCGYDSTTTARPMRWARPPATIVAILPILGAWSPTSTLGYAPGACSRWQPARSRIAPPPTAGRPSNGPTKGIAWYLPASTARPRDRASAARCAGRPWRARSPRPSEPSRQPSASHLPRRSPPSGNAELHGPSRRSPFGFPLAPAGSVSGQPAGTRKRFRYAISTPWNVP